MSEALVAWRVLSGEVDSYGGTELMSVDNMLVPGGPARTRLQTGSDPFEFVFDFGANTDVDVVALMGCNAIGSMSMSVTTGGASPGDGDAYNLDYLVASNDALIWGGQLILPLPATVTCRYLSVSASWVAAQGEYRDVRRFLPMQALRQRGLSIESSLSSASRAQALISDAQTAEVIPGVSYRTWDVRLRSLSLADLYGSDVSPGALPDLQMLQAEAGTRPEVLLIPRTDNAHMIYRTSMVGRVVGGVQLPGRARSSRQHANFQLEELVYRT